MAFLSNEEPFAMAASCEIQSRKSHQGSDELQWGVSSVSPESRQSRAEDIRLVDVHWTARGLYQVPGKIVKPTPAKPGNAKPPGFSK